MPPLRALSEAEFKACFAPPMQDMTDAQAAAADIWPYVEALHPEDFGVTNMEEVAYVYRDGLARFDHVLIATPDENVFLVIVVDVKAGAVFGHRLLNLNIEYGLASTH
jgi:hypothetical protein